MVGKLGQGRSIDRGQSYYSIGYALGQIETRLARIPGQRFNLALLAFYVLITGATMLAHRMWRNEIQAWLIARDSHGIADLIHNLGYEGHPALWHLLLMPLTRLSRDPALMQGLQLVIASATVAVVLWRAPLSRLERLVFPFGYFVLFEYGVISRSYTLGFLLLVLFCSLWRQRRDHPALLAVLLAAMANVHLFFAIVSAWALAGLVVDRIVDDSPRRSRKSPDRSWAVAAILIVAMGWAVAAAVALPPADSAGGLDRSFDSSGIRILDAIRALGVLFGSARWPAAVAGAVVLAFVLLRFRRSPAAAVFLLVSTMGILAFICVRGYVGIWAHGVIFLSFLAAVWMDRARIDAGGASPGKSGFLVPPGLLMAVLVMQAFLGLGAAMRDIARPYSNGSAAAQFIRKQGWETDPILGMPDYSASTVVGYLGVDRIYYANGRRWGSFVVWDSKRLGPIDLEAVMHDADQLGPSVTIIAAEGEPLNPTVLERHGFRLAARFEGAVVAEENYLIYHR